MKKKTFITILAALFIAGCSSQNPHSTDTETSHNHENEAAYNHDHEPEEGHIHEHETGEEHGHQEVKINITAYSDAFEMFAEADPFVVGKPSRVLSHFSHIPEFSPLETGNVAIRLEVNGESILQRLEKPTRKGIYSFNIKPEISGAGQLVFDIETGSGNYRVVAPDITVYRHEEDAYGAAEKTGPDHTNATVFTKEQSWKIDFATELPEQEPFGEVIKTTARVLSAQNDEMVLTSKTNGVALFTNATVLPGNKVSSGQALFMVSGSNFADNNSTVRFVEAKNNYEKAKLDYERIQKLAADKIVSRKELLEAKNTFENAGAIFNNLNKNFSASGQTIKSPVNGFIKNLYVQNGEYVEAGQPVALVSQNRKLMLYAEVQPKYAADLTFLKTANIQTANKQKTWSLEQLNGKIISWGKSANHDNYLVPVHLEIDNNGEFFPGTFVKAFLKTTSDQHALTIPLSALLEEQGLYYVFVQITPELFEKREIKTGASDGIKTEVPGGLRPDERVVTKGAVFIKLSQSSGALDPHAGHVH
jgi:RND family efflux transporter MFP subunit